MTEYAEMFNVLGVLGPGMATAELEQVAEAAGGLAARCGWAVLTGGGPGVMAAACRGAVENGGLTLGVIPFAKPSQDYPNPWVRVPIYTGIGIARNAVNVLSSTLCLAVGGGTGTLSEIALALKAGVPVWCWSSWQLEPPQHTVAAPGPRLFDDSDALMRALEERMKGHGG